MEDYVATGQHPPLHKCLADVASCDGYVGLFAWKYGYIPHDNNPEQRSITELEYRQAKELGKPCFIFLLDEGANWSPLQMDQVTGEGEKGQRIVALRQDLGSAKLFSKFQAPNELASLVSAALNKWQADLRRGEEPEEPEGPFEDICPYVGLEAFTKETARFFKGRDRFVQTLLAKLGESNFVPVIGASGSGKSSLVRAGVIPILEDSGNWQVLPPIMPGYSPLNPVNEISRSLSQLCKRPQEKTQVALALEAGKLGEAISVLPGSQSLLLVVDQFEEIFSVCPEENEVERTKFLDLLVSIAHFNGSVAEPPTSSRLKVVTTMRADFFDNCLKYRDLGEVIQSNQVLLLPMNEDELIEVIKSPANLAGYKLGPGLLPAIMRDVREEKNILPLLEFALTQVWERRDNRIFTFEAYDALGGVSDALNHHAEGIYSALSEAEQYWVERICLKLVRVGPEQKDTRHRRSKSDLLDLATAEQQSVLESTLKELVDGRLLVTGKSIFPNPETDATEAALSLHPEGKDKSSINDSWVDLSHEALMYAWKRFEQWRRADRDQHRLIQRVEDAEKEWYRKAKNEDYLLQRGLLAEVREQWSQLEPKLGPKTREYFQTSDQQEQQQVAFLERTRTESKLREEVMQILNLTTARPIPSTAARAIHTVGTSYGKLQGEVLTSVKGALPAVIDHIRECGRFQGHGASVLSVAFSPDGQTIVSGSEDMSVR